MFGQLADRLRVKKVSVELAPEARSYIAGKGYDKLLGARPIQRFIDSEITQKLTQEILFGNLASGGSVKVVVRDGGLGFELE